MQSLPKGSSGAAPQVAVLGLRWREFIRLQEKVKQLPIRVSLIYGGHLSEGSNCSIRATQACSSANCVLWCLEGLRKLPSGFAPGYRMIRIQGVSSAFNAMKSLTQCA